MRAHNSEEFGAMLPIEKFLERSRGDLGVNQLGGFPNNPDVTRGAGRPDAAVPTLSVPTTYRKELIIFQKIRFAIKRIIK
jgi:hypothetical protein